MINYSSITQKSFWLFAVKLKTSKCEIWLKYVLVVVAFACVYKHLLLFAISYKPIKIIHNFVISTNKRKHIFRIITGHDP